jgi:hypothetical protein
MLRRGGLPLVLIMLASAGCSFEQPTYAKKVKAGFKPGMFFEVNTSAHSKNQKMVVQVRSDGVPVDICAIYDQPNRTQDARDHLRKGEMPLDTLKHAQKEPNPILKFDLQAKAPLRVLIFNSSDRTPDLEVEIKAE